MEEGIPGRIFCTERTCIVVVEIGDPPDFGNGRNRGFVQGMAKIAGGVKILLDIDRILTGEQLDGLAVLH